MRQHIKKITFVLISAITIVFSSPANTMALNGKYDPDFFANNNIFFYNPDSKSCITNTGGTTCTIDESKLNSDKGEAQYSVKAKIGSNLPHITTALNILMTAKITNNDNKPLSKELIAGIFGNIAQESEWNPETGKGGSHVGLIQWGGGRKANLEMKANPWSAKDQIDFLVEELNGAEGKGLADAGFFSMTDPGEIALKFNTVFERSGESPSSQQAINRKQWAKDFLAAFDCSQATSSASGSAGAGTGIELQFNSTFKYSSGFKGPYIMEHFAIHLLKAIGQKTGVSESEMVTQEKVATVVAHAIKEGGDIMNTSKFNPFNLGGGEGYEGTNDGRGHFKDFDSMITAYTRQVTSGTQSRIGQVLSEPDFTYQKFNHAWSHFEEYPGNDFWAEAAGVRGQTDIHDSYTKQLNNIVADTIKDYKGRASIIIGTDAFEQRDGLRNDKLLTFDGSGVVIGSGDFSGNGSDGICGGTSSVSSGSIADTAKKLAWDNDSNYSKLKPEWTEAVKSLGDPETLDWAQDCGRFVSVVMRSSGVDKDFPKSGTVTQWDYMESSRNYERVGAKSMSDLKPGDIAVVGGTGASGHIWIYVGDTTDSSGKTRNATDASLGQRTGNYSYYNQLEDPLDRGTYEVFRHKGV